MGKGSLNGSNKNYSELLWVFFVGDTFHHICVWFFYFFFWRLNPYFWALIQHHRFHTFCTVHVYLFRFGLFTHVHVNAGRDRRFASAFWRPVAPFSIFKSSNRRGREQAKKGRRPYPSSRQLEGSQRASEEFFIIHRNPEENTGVIHDTKRQAEIERQTGRRTERQAGTNRQYSSLVW